MHHVARFPSARSRGPVPAAVLLAALLPALSLVLPAPVVAASLPAHPVDSLAASQAGVTSTGGAGDPEAVMAVVNRLFDGMRARDGAMVASAFHPEARLMTTGTGPDGRPRVQVTPVQGFVDAVGAGGEPWNEPISGTEIRIDDHLAQVWTHYRFYRGETFSHCGVNAIQLAWTGDEDGWRIVHLVDTRRTEGCDP